MTPLRPAGLVLHDGFSFPMLGQLVESLCQNGLEAGSAAGWCILTPDGRPVRADNGIMVQPEDPRCPVRDFACLVLIGGHWPGPAPWLAALAQDSVPVVLLRAAAQTASEDLGLSWHGPVLLAEPETITPLIRRFLRPSGDAGQDARAGAPDPGPALASARDPLVARTLHRMRQSLETAHRISDLSREMNVGRRMLERRFRADIGLSPQAAYAALRLERAIQLLRTTQVSLSEIAFSCGFCDASHLVRTMKSKLKLAPGTFRQPQ